MSFSSSDHLQTALQHHQAGRWHEAAQLYRQVLAQHPSHTEALKLLGTLAEQTQDLPLALNAYQEAIATEPTQIHLYLSLGRLYHRHHQISEAIAVYQQALDRGVAAATLQAQLAAALDDQQDYAAAAQHYQQAIALDPQDALLHHNLGTVCHKQQDLSQAIRHYQRAIALKADYAKAHLNLGTALQQLGETHQAIAAYEQAIALDPSLALAYDALGSIYLALGDLSRAVDYYRQAIALQPDHADTHVNLAMALLRSGDLAAGFTEYEWRRRDRPLPEPRWDGSPLQGQVILLHAEQGFGDAIQFIRYVSAVVQRGGRVWVGCPSPLVRLFQSVPGVETAGSAIDAGQVQQHAALMSLPHLLGTTLETIPAPIPYIDLAPLWDTRAQAIAARIATFAEQVPSHRRIGLVWAGSAGNPDDQYRTCPAALLQPLLAQPKCLFYSLQVGDRRSELATLAPQGEVLDLGDDVQDFADTAIAISQLDGVITVDTAVAHLAGALGKPVWILLSTQPDWRWLDERRDSPWYPTARLFRQPQPGDWSTVIANVGRAIAQGGLPRSPKPSADPSPAQPVEPHLSVIQQGFVHHQAGRLEQAAPFYQSILQQDPDHMEALQLLGTLVCQQQRYAEGADYLRRALALKPTYAEGYYNLGSALQNLEQSEEAIAAFQQAIALRPDYPEAHLNLGTIYKRRQQYAEAAEQFQAAIALRPDYAKAWRSLGSVLRIQNRCEEAIPCYERALAIDPTYAHAYSSWGYLLTEMGQLPAAMEKYEQAIALDPDHVDAQFGRAALHLRMGNFLEGFAGYEWRWKYDYCPPRDFFQPLWTGDRFAGKTLLLHDEQGLGDAIQAMRFVPLVIALGGRVVLECRDVLMRLFQTVPGVDQWVIRGEPLPEFDCHAPLMSLPWLLQITLDTLPNQVPYLSVPPTTQLTLPATPPGIRKLGIVWAANPVNKTGSKRSCPLDHWQAIAQQPGLQLYSLQKDPNPEDQAWLRAHGVIDLSGALSDLAETAAAIAQLDLVITVDTAVAHLSGALGQPTWVLLPAMADWRWMVDRSDSPWYPTARLFRQTTSGDWSPVIAAIATALTTPSFLAPPSTPVDPAQHRSITATSPQIVPAASDRPSRSALLKTAVAQHQAGQLEAAKALYEQLRDRYPQDGNAMHLLGVIAYQSGELDEAIALYQQALDRLPHYAELHNNLAVALDKAGQTEQAQGHYQQAIALKPDYAEAWHNLGTLYQGQDRIDDAIQQYQQAIALKPNYADGYNSWGSALKRGDRLEEALNYYNRALALEPNHLEARCGRAAVLLKLGQFTQGWEDYEWRWQHPDCPPRQFQQPMWTGDEVRGTLLLYTEQGLGDAIQMVRYLPQVQARCDRLWIECHQPGLGRLFRTLAASLGGDIQVFELGQVPDGVTYQAPFMSLPRIFGTTLETIPAACPYLLPPPETLGPLPAHDPRRANIGIVWTANRLSKTGEQRSCSLDDLKPLLSLASLASVNLYSLQKDVLPEEQAVLDRAGVISLGSQFTDLADTAGAIAQLDLVITVDTVIAHLAGALGKPTWVLLHLSCDWRWLSDRPDSPWYPTLRLFRQTQANDWQPAIAQLLAQLQEHYPMTPPAPTPTKHILGVGWPMSLMTGWGNFGINLVLQLQQMPDFAPVLLAKSEAIDQLNPLHRSLLEPIVAEYQRLQALLDANPGKQLQLNVPVLHALGNGLQGGLMPKLRGDRNLGVIFLEDTHLPPEAIARGRQYELLIAGSQWNETVLRAAGLDHAYASPQGIDPTRFHPGPKSGLLGDRFVIFSGGKLEYRKGQDLVVAAVRRFVERHPDTLLLTAWHNFWPQFMQGIDRSHVQGLPTIDAQRRLQVKPWLAANGIPPQQVIDIGPIPNYLMGEVIREADVAVFPNRGEGGTNLAAMECLACGIPTILSANTGHLDIIGEHCYPLRHQAPVQPIAPFVGVEGWGESDVDEIVEALEQVYSDRSTARQKGQAAAEFMQDWTWAKQVRRMGEILQRTGVV
ncbi:tetratricopeptide repeat protein [Leptolyngbya sp. CCY15150]|uniref:tetratricopeptide repeat protein n=1 Tax=Leptolyngbya sp. CCY15150 TaxID=2767772 RepID=UPI00195119EE|nr:tetratricopeptide repeat protein [Leptolyngbya sp. CCY15150]